MFDQKVLDEFETAAGREGTSGARLDRLTTLGCGGPAAILMEIDSPEELASVLAVASANSIDWFVLGYGSNLLVADSGWDGLVIRLSGELKECVVQEEGRLECGAGAALTRAASAAAAAGLSGLEPLAGIPGTIGGAVAMNAGAWGTEIGNIIGRVLVCLPGECRELSAGDMRFSYRHCELPEGSVIARVTLALDYDEPDNIREATAGFSGRRSEAQPTGERTCGSVFRNPPEGPRAGELLDSSGCKGLERGGAMVTEAHANFIANRGGATATDIVWLMDECRRRVYDQAGIVLEPEVRFLGDISLEPL
ncbi:MAG: UDP-N-acetylmuramate dehydrogenase [Thermoleophilia bacterium]|nr:UDP-N-acetylmuramate dehydrogenase [Thermoleophilia bacterium]